MKNIIFPLFLSLSCIIAHAQSPVSRYFGNSDLTCNLITEICQDEDGFIWIGTINGLNRYDGWTFKHIFADDADSTTLLSNYIYEIFCDSHDRLWVGTNLGLQLYDRDANVFTNVHYPDGRMVPTEHLVELTNGDLWIYNGNIYRLDSTHMTAEPVEEINKATSSSVIAVFSDSAGTVWISGNRGKIFLCRNDRIQSIDTDVPLRSFVECDGELYASAGNSVYRWNNQDSCFTALPNVCPPYSQAKLLSTHDGRILVTTAGQGFRTVDRTGMRVIPMNDFRNKEIDINQIIIEDWIEDRSGNIWLGSTFNGLAMISHSYPDFISMGADRISSSLQDMANAVYFDGDCVTWVGYESGELYQIGNEGQRSLVNILPASIYSIYEQDSTHLLVGTKYSGLHIVDKITGTSSIVKGTEGLYIKKIIPCPDGNIAVSAFSEGISFYDKDAKVLSGNIRAGTVNTLLFDKDGFIWCGTYGGLKAYNYADRNEQNIQTNVQLNASTVYSLYEGNDGIIWIGSSGGLFSYDKATESFFHHNAGGLTNNVICGIAGDLEGNIWVSTFDGIIKYDPEEGNTNIYRAGHGLYDTEYVRGSYWQDPRTGMIFFGGQHDVVGFVPEQIVSQPFITAPVLTELYINDKSTWPKLISGKKQISDSKFAKARIINLASDDNDLRLSFSMMDFRDTENIRIAYSFDNESETHLSSFGSNTITLNNIKPGKHNLAVLFNENGITSPPTTLTIIIRQPWYATWPAVLIYIILAGGMALPIRKLYKTISVKIERYKANEKRLDFFTRLSYELRSPLTLITIPLQKLLKNTSGEDESKALKMMQKNAEKTISLLNKSLEVRRIDDDGANMHYTQTDLISLISNLLVGVEYIARQHDIDISYKHDMESLLVWIDKRSLSKAISNLINNAVKASAKGSKIIISTRIAGNNAETVFEDQGRAISELAMAHMFELPYRSDSGNISGTDIDLYLSREIIRHHNGSLTAANIEGSAGRRFTARIPLGKSHIPLKRIVDDDSALMPPLEQSIYYGDISSDSEKGQSPNNSKKYSVIAIDESEDICRYVSGVLGSRFKVSTFTSGLDGYNFALTNVPALIITDLMMPDLDGISLLKRIRGNSNTAHVPVLLLTSITEDDIRLKGLLTGADAIITKPFNEEELILVSTNLIMSRSRLASRLKGRQVTEEMLQPVEITSNNDVLIQKVINTINENIGNPDLDIDMLTGKVGISRAHLHRKIKEITGLSPGEYIRSIRLNQAAELLKGEKKNISQIAYSLGYSNPSVFSNTFKKFFGMTAKEYQDKHAGQTESKKPDAPE